VRDACVVLTVMTMMTVILHRQRHLTTCLKHRSQRFGFRTFYEVKVDPD